ncbi:12692_t:CDS:2 [Ambispora gerdemannii]|uniref:12692_t:CDS:1 n=1 Tax=Ambispora gerdemannii TaxID=144530 RepID=A0A9N9D5X5_9GLOM|nr:12692_t:CDS:2 [Ambispora gerdemannii]
MSYSKVSFPKHAERPLVTLEQQDEIFILTMKDGENRFTVTFIEALFAALDEVERIRGDSTEPAALVTTGEGKFYSNGLDLEHALSTPNFFENYYLKFLVRLLTFPIPTVAALNGHAFAGGFMMAFAHDYRVMRIDRGYLCMNEIDIPSPVHPGMAAIVRVKMSNAKTFRDCLLQGYRFNAQEALNRELVDIIAPADQVLPKAKELAKKWSVKARAGPIYKSLKEEMYYEIINFMTMPDWAKPNL